MKIVKIAPKLCLFFLLLAGCNKPAQVQDPQLSLISEKHEIQIGQDYFPLLIQTQGGSYSAHNNIREYIQKVGNRLAKVSHRPNLPFEFEVINLSIPYAWSLPGGKVAISRRMLLLIESEAELAAILAHELAHSIEDYQAGRGILLEKNSPIKMDKCDKCPEDFFTKDNFAKWNQPIFFPFTSEIEQNADKLAMKYMVRAGYDPQALITSKKKLIEKRMDEICDLEVYFTTHPYNDRILQSLQSYVFEYRKGGYLGKRAYNDAITILRQKSLSYDYLDGAYRALENENPERALELVEEGLAIEPREALLHALKGKALGDLGNLEQAILSFNKALELNPHYYDFFLSRGEIYLQMENLDQARSDLENAQKILPSSEGFFHLGNLEYKEGNLEKAEFNFQICAHSHAQISKKAQVLLEKLEMKHPFPFKNILLSVDKLSRGRLKIKVRNAGKQTAKNIHIRIDLISQPHKMIVPKEITIAEEIKPGDHTTLITKIGSFHQKISDPNFIEPLVTYAEFE